MSLDTVAPVWRSLLYVPVNVERYVAKAHTRGADAIILDLEDSIPLAAKADARGMVQDAAARVSRGGADVVVRINRPLQHAVRDIEACISTAVSTLWVAKTASAGHIRLIADLVDELEAERGISLGHTRLIAQVETADAFHGMRETAAAHPRIVAMGLGSEDFALSLGIEPRPDAFRTPKQEALIAARAAGVTPLGLIGSVAGFSDLAEMRQILETSERFGFEGAACIHPAVVPILNEVFSPTEREVAAAKRIVAAFEDAIADGRASLEVDGRMIDYPVAARAERVIARDEAIRQRNQRILE